MFKNLETATASWKPIGVRQEKIISINKFIIYGKKATKKSKYKKCVLLKFGCEMLRANFYGFKRLYKLYDI